MMGHFPLPTSLRLFTRTRINFFESSCPLVSGIEFEVLFGALHVLELGLDHARYAKFQTLSPLVAAGRLLGPFTDLPLAKIMSPGAPS